jgi:4-amino-4-deoxychorismate lyase
MYRFLESIKYDMGVLFHLEYHQERINRAFASHFKNRKPWDLREILEVPENLTGMNKCRLVYDESSYRCEFLPYSMPNISTLRIIPVSDLNYTHKYLDRSRLDDIFQQRKTCDDVIILHDGFLTDSSYANLAFFDGKTWHTPERPLLKGTKRQFLLENNQLKTANLRQEDISGFNKVSLINAMLDLDQVVVPVSGIF